MTSLVQPKKKEKSPLSKPQNTFNRLKNKVEKLQQLLKDTQADLDLALAFYHEKLLPAKESVAGHLTNCIKLMYQHYKNHPRLSHKTYKFLKELILNKIEYIFSIIMFKNCDPQVVTIYKELGGIDYKEAISDELTDFKLNMENMFKKNGLDIDLTSLNLHDDENDIAHKVFEAMRDGFTKMVEEEEPILHPKTKKELEKEKRAQELENLQKNGLSKIYKKLAKALHPDLEQDPGEKAKKESMMKKLTDAYENNDLYTLLSMEMEWMNYSEIRDNNEKITNDEQLHIYNSILKEQVELLEDNINLLYLNPRYIPIFQYLSDEFFSPKEMMEMAFELAKIESSEYEYINKKLQSNESAKTLDSIIEIFSL